MRISRYVTVLVALVLVVWGLFVLLNWRLNSGTGLTQTFYQGTGVDRQLLVRRITRTVDLGILADDRRLPRSWFSVSWSGVWYIPTHALYDVSLNGGGPAILRIDGRVVQEYSAAEHAANPRTISLEAGYHSLEVGYQHESGNPALDLSAARAGDVLRPLNPDQLFPTTPGYPRLRRLLEAVRGILRLFGLAALGIAAWLGLLGLVKWFSGFLAHRGGNSISPRARQILAVAIPVLVVVYASALRFDALTLTYGQVERPQLLRTVQQHSGSVLQWLQPGSVTWSPALASRHRDGKLSLYSSDPYTYLQFARQMHSFYAAHYREPLFPFVTKIFLHLLDDQDIAVSFASAFFSVLAVIATYLLGSYAFSRWVGIGAALAMAIEYDVIAWGVSGWRDDAFTFSVVMFAYTLLRWSRVPSTRNAAVMGVVAAAACLVRITSLSFLLPAFACVLVATKCPWKERVDGIGVAALTMAAIVAPYLINCWITFGDPLYAINFHAGIYETTEIHAARPGPTAAAYIGAKAANRPIQTLDTVILGLTSYPFANKWHGFDRWAPALGTCLSWTALFGLLLFVGSSSGRLLLVVLVTSLVPYAVTWKIASDWRFTEHAYPFYLIASAAAVGQIVTWTAPSRLRGLLTPQRGWLKPLVFWTGMLIIAGAAGWIVLRALPVLAARETLLANEDMTIAAGFRDAPFFGRGWYPALTTGNVTARVSKGLYSEMWVPLPAVQDYDLTVRLDPFPRPLGAVENRDLPRVRVFVNGNPVSNLELDWNPDRVGSYDMKLRRAAVTAGFNRLSFVAEARAAVSSADGQRPQAGGSDGPAFRLWYVRIRPCAVP